jgi:hypothetical protein
VAGRRQGIGQTGGSVVGVGVYRESIPPERLQVALYCVGGFALDPPPSPACVAWCLCCGGQGDVAVDVRRRPSEWMLWRRSASPGARNHGVVYVVYIEQKHACRLGQRRGDIDGAGSRIETGDGTPSPPRAS